MIIIPKEEMERMNSLRYELLLRKNALVDKIIEIRKMKAGFTATEEQIQELKDGEMKNSIAEIVVLKENARKAAENLGVEDTWFDSIPSEIEMKEKQESERLNREEQETI